MILRLKRTPGIYLVGFMACGKTTIGRLLAGELGWHFVDIDDDIEARAKTSISAIFDTLGEAEFRKLEAAAIGDRVRLIERGKPTVVALGGGAFGPWRRQRRSPSQAGACWQPWWRTRPPGGPSCLCCSGASGSW